MENFYSEHFLKVIVLETIIKQLSIDFLTKGFDIDKFNDSMDSVKLQLKNSHTENTLSIQEELLLIDIMLKHVEIIENLLLKTIDSSR